MAGGDSDGYASLSIVDVSDPASPRPLALLDSDDLGLGFYQLTAITVVEEVAYAGQRHVGKVVVIDVADPEQPRPIGVLKAPRAIDYAAFAQSGRSWIAVGNDWATDTTLLHVIRPVDKDAGTEGTVAALLEGAISLPSRFLPEYVASPLATQGGFAYVALGDLGGLAVVSMEKPAEPRIVGILGPE